MPRLLRTLAALLIAGLVAGLASAPALAQVPVRAGYEIPYAAESPHPYPTGTGTTPAWTLRVEHPDATYIAIHFDRFDLAPGDRLVIRSESGRQRHVLTEHGRHGLGTFWAPHIKGEAAVLELMSPGRNQGGWGVSIDSYAAGVVDMGSEAGGTEAVCGADDREDAKCYQVSEPVVYDKSRAVARLLIDGQFFCTGWLVGCQGHLFTNNHCIVGLAVDPPTAVVNTDYEFLAESACNGGFGAGPLWGGVPTLVARDVDLDYAFILLAGDPQSIYGSFSLDNRPPVAGERIYIPQHPGGRPKEIALLSTDPTDESGFCEITQPQSAITCAGGPGDVTYQCDSQGGSSGSPVVAYVSQAAVALHHCSLAIPGDPPIPICPNLGVPITAIVSDLGANLPQCAILDAFSDLVHDAHSVDDDAFGNNNGVAEPVEIVNLAVDLRNAGNFQTGNVSAVLSTATPGITILDNTADWPTVPSLGTVTSLPPHFQVKVAQSVPCGTVMNFDLAISSDAGPFAASFQEMVGSTAGGSGTFSAVDTPLPIPDNSPPGVISTAPVSASFPIGVLTVSVDISHTRIGDLLVDLTSPIGTTVRLHDGSGGNGNDILTTYDTLTFSDGPGSTADFLGENVLGNWQLKVVDTRSGESGVINSWSLFAAQSAAVVCDPVPCQVTAAASATPDTVCDGGSLLLADAGSSEFGDDCSGTLEYQFKLFAELLQDWSTDPDLVVTPAFSTSYTVRVRDQVTLGQDLAVVPVTVLAPPVASATQTPDPMCLEFPGVTLDAGPGFTSYTWRDDLAQVVGASQTLALNPTACGRTYSVEVASGGPCTDTANLVVQCETCTPLEVSPAGSPVPLRMDVDGLGTIELELQPDPAVIYHLYRADSVASFLAGDWTHKFCDLESGGAIGSWTQVDANTGRWTPLVPGVVFEGYWVAVADKLTLEGPYGIMSGGSPRPPDTDRAGSAGNFGCP